MGQALSKRLKKKKQRDQNTQDVDEHSSPRRIESMDLVTRWVDEQTPLPADGDLVFEGNYDFTELMHIITQPLGQRYLGKFMHRRESLARLYCWVGLYYSLLSIISIIIHYQYYYSLFVIIHYYYYLEGLYIDFRIKKQK